MKTVQLPNAATKNTQMVIHTSTENAYISLTKEFRKHLSDPSHAHELIYHDKYRKHASNRKETEREYHFQDSKDVQQKSLKMPYDSTQFPALRFFGPRENPHGILGLSKHYHLRLEPKLGNGKCAIIRIPCACNARTKMLGNTWEIGVDLIDQPL